MKLSKVDFVLWVSDIDRRLEWINYKGYFFEDGVYKLGFRGRRHNLCLIDGHDRVIAYGLNGIEEAVQRLEKFYASKPLYDEDDNFIGGF